MNEVYLTYAEYQKYGGSLTEADFTLLEFKARKRIDYWTDSRVKDMAEIPEEVKLCIMSLIKAEAVYGVDAQLDSPTVASFNTDGYSESYGSASEQTANVEQGIRKMVRQMLYGVCDDEGVPLLYRGLNG